MGFPLYALLGDEAPEISNETLASSLKELFGGDDGFSLKFEQIPFMKHGSLALRWGDWRVSVAYEEGDNVKADSIEIQKLVSSEYNISGINRRISVVFSNDPSRRYTNEIIRLMDFLRVIKGVVLFDAKQKRLMSFD